LIINNQFFFSGIALYFKEFYEEIVIPKMSKNSVFVTQSGACGVLNSEEVFTTIHNTLKASFSHVHGYSVEVLIFFYFIFWEGREKKGKGKKRRRREGGRRREEKERKEEGGRGEREEKRKKEGKRKRGVAWIHSCKHPCIRTCVHTYTNTYIHTHT
jgi:hypothetical protein